MAGMPYWKDRELIVYNFLLMALGMESPLWIEVVVHNNSVSLFGVDGG